MRFGRFLAAMVAVVACAADVSSQDTVSEEIPSLDSLLSIPIRAASRYEQTAREAPASISVITREDIETSGFLTLGEVLASLQGFYTTYDRSFLSVGVRGFGPSTDNNNRILLLLDGVRQNDMLAGAAALGSEFYQDLEIIERIEVVRGPGSALYGNSAVFAVVNVVTRSGAELDGGRVRTQAGSFGTQAGTVTYGRALPGGGDFVVHGSWSNSDGQDLYFPEYDNPLTGNGITVGRDFESSHGWWGRLRFSDLSFIAGGGGREKSDPTAPFGASFGDVASRDEDSFSVQGTWERNLSSRVSARVSGYHSQSWVIGQYSYDDPQPDRSIDASGDLQGLDAQVRIDAGPANRIIFGTDLMRLDSEIRISSFLGPGDDVGGSKSVVSFYGQTEWQATENLSLVLGARLDRHRYAGSSLSPRVGAVLHPTENATVKAMYGEAFRAPTVFEQFVEEPPILLGNRDLGPEGIRTTELVWEQRLTTGVHATASVYHFDMDGLIGQAPDPALGGVVFQNLGKAHTVGLELGLTAVLGRASYFAGYNYQDADSPETGAPLVNSPHHMVRAGMRYRAPLGVRVAVHGSYDGSRMTHQGTELDGHGLLGVSFGLPLVGPFRASVRVWNLFDSEYQTPATPSHRQAALTQDGRVFRMSLSAVF